MKADEFKIQVEKILGAEIKFDGHLNQIINTVDEHKQRLLLNWVQQCKEGIVIPEPCKRFRHLIAFIYKSHDNMIRGILTKEKNAYFVELFLDKHKYYDRKRRYLGL